jgi:hypothetical protein
MIKALAEGEERLYERYQEAFNKSQMELDGLNTLAQFQASARFYAYREALKILKQVDKK